MQGEATHCHSGGDKKIHHVIVRTAGAQGEETEKHKAGVK